MPQNTNLTADAIALQMVAEWRNRPNDERFETLDALYDAAQERETRCETHLTTTKRIRPQALPMMPGQDAPEIGADLDEVDRHFGLVFETEAGPLDTTHWAFGQLASTIRTPADYLRRVDTRLAAHLIDYGLGFLAPRDEYKLFVERLPERGDLLQMRAMTGKGYGRIDDSEVVDLVRNVADPNIWQPPAHNYSGPAGSKKATTLYYGDRDVTIFLVDQQTPIEISVAGKEEALYRGFVVRNSMVGARKFEAFLFFFVYSCANRLVWAPRSMQEIGIRHTANAPDRFRQEAAPMLERFAAADVSEVRTRIERAMRLEAGRDEETITGWLSKRGFGKGEAKRVYQRAKEDAGGDEPKSVWELIQGGTQLAHGIGHQDTRLQQEERWSKLLDRVAA